MAHYYDYDPNLSKEEFPVRFEIGGKSFQLSSSAGVFSSEKLDTGSRILAQYLIDHVHLSGHILDLGCGIGILGVILSAFFDVDVTGIDVNEQAVHLAGENYKKNKVSGKVLLQDHVNDEQYSAVILNPPIRAGKQTIYSLFAQSAQHLLPGGDLWIVIRKQHGAQSAMDYLETLGLQTERVFRDKGFWIVRAHKPQ